MSEVCEQASHAATFGVQRGKIRERSILFQLGIYFGRLRLRAEFVWLPLASFISLVPISGTFDPLG